jgi:hypothetical protein
MRGVLRGVVNPSGEKLWRVDLLDSQMIWYELVLRNLHPEVDSRTAMKGVIRQLKRKHEDYFNRRFVYFICSREKVRFSVQRQARFSFLRRKLVIHLEIGSERRLKRCVVPAALLRRISGIGRSVLPQVENSDIAITCTYPGGQKVTTSIHDFLLDAGINLGINTCIHYVGMTKNPDTRPLLRKHDGRTRTLALTRDASRDIFFFYNTFAVRCLASDPHIVYWLSNAMTDEVDIQTEGLLLEKLLIGYFKPDCQGNLQSECTQLQNLFWKLADSRKITRMSVDLEVLDTSEYYTFYSSQAPPSSAHVFSVCPMDSVSSPK